MKLEPPDSGKGFGGQAQIQLTEPAQLAGGQAKFTALTIAQMIKCAMLQAAFMHKVQQTAIGIKNLKPWQQQLADKGAALLEVPGAM